MKFSIFTFDVLALLILAIPALLLLDAVAPALGGLGPFYLGSILLGVFCLTTDLALINRRKADSANLLGLSMAGVALIVAPSVMLVLAASHV